MLQEAYKTQESKTLDIFKRHLAAFTSGDLEKVLEDFSTESLVITQDGVFEGQDGARRVFGALLEEFGTIDRGDSPGFTFDVQHASRNTLFITWHAESKNLVFPFGTDTFICHGEKIVRQSIAFSTPIPRRTG